MLVIPGKMGISTYSPLLDKNSNSVRGLQFCQELSERLKYHIFHKSNSLTGQSSSLKSVIHYCAVGDLNSVKHLDFIG